MDRVFDDNTAAWLIGAPDDTPSAPLARDLDVDIAIIGGGFTGVSAAYHLSRAQPKLGIALLEATQLGNGASGRNGGLVLNGITVKDVELEQVLREHQITRAAIDGIAEIIQRHGLNVRFRRTGCLSIATTARSAENAHAEVEALAAHGLALEYLPREELAKRLQIEHAHGAVFDATEAHLIGVDLLRGLRPVLVAQGVQIFEGTPVIRIREGQTIELTTASHTVRARAIVLATSGYTPRLGYFRSGLLPVISHVIATEPVPELAAKLGLAAIAGMYDDLPRLAYCSADAEGRIVFGGGSTAAYAYRFGNATTYDARLGDAATTALRESLARYFPALAEVPIEHRWSGPLDLTLPRHCAIGVTGAHRNIYYGVGYSGHGITLANLAGRVIADLYAGNDEAWRDLAFCKLQPGGIPPEPFRWIGYHLYTKLTGHSPWKRTD